MLITALQIANLVRKKHFNHFLCFWKLAFLVLYRFFFSITLTYFAGNEVCHCWMNVWTETISTGWIPTISVSRWSLSDNQQAAHSSRGCVNEGALSVITMNAFVQKKGHWYMTISWKSSAFTLETVRSVISCSKARVSSACFWLCSAIFSLNFLGFEPPVPGEPDIVRAAVLQLQLLGKKVVDDAGSLKSKVFQWALQWTHQSFKNIAHITVWPKLLQSQLCWLQDHNWVCYCKPS